MAYNQPADAHEIINIHVPRPLFKDGKPAGTIPPYKHQPFPKAVYPKNGGFPKIVNDETEEKAALAKGWLALPPEDHTIAPSGELVPPPKPDKKG